MKFVDYTTVHVKAGDGGKGSVSFRREKYVPRGGPDGGDGGRGGHIIFRATKELNTLLDFRYKRDYLAERGKNGQKKKMHGRDGKDLIIRVPVGTIIKDGVAGEIVADLDSDGKEAIAVKGGRVRALSSLCLTGLSLGSPHAYISQIKRTRTSYYGVRGAPAYGRGRLALWRIPRRHTGFGEWF